MPPYKKTMQVLERMELALLVTDDWQSYENDLVKLFAANNTPVVVAAIAALIPNSPRIK
jgi:hypothetical protein